MNDDEKAVTGSVVVDRRCIECWHASVPIDREPCVSCVRFDRWEPAGKRKQAKK